jgi:DNA-directed RNA polymerase sigma subunit (sigma70/sigma32)
LTFGLDRSELTERQQQVLALRLIGGTLADIGLQLGISSERVRQIEARLMYLARRQKLA